MSEQILEVLFGELMKLSVFLLHLLLLVFSHGDVKRH